MVLDELDDTSTMTKMVTDKKAAFFTFHSVKIYYSFNVIIFLTYNNFENHNSIPFKAWIDCCVNQRLSVKRDSAYKT